MQGGVTFFLLGHSSNGLKVGLDQAEAPEPPAWEWTPDAWVTLCFFPRHITSAATGSELVPCGLLAVKVAVPLTELLTCFLAASCGIK